VEIIIPVLVVCLVLAFFAVAIKVLYG